MRVRDLDEVAGYVRSGLAGSWATAPWLLTPGAILLPLRAVIRPRPAGQSLAAELITAVAVLAVSAAVLWLAGRVRIGRGASSAWSAIACYVVTAVAGALTLAGVSDYHDITAGLVLSQLLMTVTWLTFAAAAVGQWRRWRDISLQLRATSDRLSRVEAERSTQLDRLRTAITDQVTQHAVPDVAALARDLRAGTAGEHGSGYAARARSLADQVGRDLSTAVAQPDPAGAQPIAPSRAGLSGEPGRIRPWPLIDPFTTVTAFPVWPTVLLLWIVGVPYGWRTIGAAIGVGAPLLVAVGVMGVLTVGRRWCWPLMRSMSWPARCLLTVMLTAVAVALGSALPYVVLTGPGGMAVTVGSYSAVVVQVAVAVALFGIGWSLIAAWNQDSRRRVNEQSMQAARIALAIERMAAEEARERRRVARLLHGRVQNQLFAVAMLLALSEARHDRAAAAGRLTGVVAELQGLTAPAPERDDLRASLRHLTDQWQPLLSITTDVTDHAAREIRAGGPQATAAVVETVQEGLTNAVRHSRATRVEVAVDVLAGDLVITVSDNGTAKPAHRGDRRGTGLPGLAALGAHWQLSTGPAGGTLLRVTWPAQVWQPAPPLRPAAPAALAGARS